MPCPQIAVAAFDTFKELLADTKYPLAAQVFTVALLMEIIKRSQNGDMI
jgi:hypothetical protein